MDAKERSRRYLLGELAEGERTAFEETYFADPRVFAEVADAENALVDEYVRGRLAADVRQRFAQVYLADPRRRERVRFAQALVTRVDATGGAVEASAVSPRRVHSDEPRWIATLFGATPAWRWALASLLIAIVAGGSWFLFQGRSGQESTRATVAPGPDGPEAPPSPSGPAAPGPGAPSAPVVLALSVGPGVRSVEPSAPVVLVIPPNTSEVHLVLTLRENDYPNYRVLVRAIGGAEILRRSDLRPSAQAAGATLSLTAPARGFSPGDYMLTLQGPARGGEFEDLSQSLFRVR